MGRDSLVPAAATATNASENPWPVRTLFSAAQGCYRLAIGRNGWKKAHGACPTVTF